MSDIVSQKSPKVNLHKPAALFQSKDSSLFPLYLFLDWLFKHLWRKKSSKHLDFSTRLFCDNGVEDCGLSSAEMVYGESSRSLSLVSSY
jgi:hypothetical protein